MTVLEAIQKSADFLSKKGVDSPRLQAELLLAHLLKLPRMKLYLDFERQLGPADTGALRDLVMRRGQREPLQHILGSTSFCGYEISVNRHVLVPRPETELLAEAGWLFLSTINNEQSTALDFGAGSGCVAIALAAKCPTARVWALDMSPDAVAVARQNAARNAVDDRIEFLLGDGFAALTECGQPGSQFPARSGAPGIPQFDLIISNPPYIPREEIQTLQPEVRDYDPHGALDGGVDGLEFYRLLAAQAKAFLRPGGRLMVEFGDGQDGDIAGIFSGQNWIVETTKPDYSQRPRFLIARAK